MHGGHASPTTRPRTARPPRIELLDAARAPITAQSWYVDGDPGPIVAALAHVPELVAPTLGFVGAALTPGAVAARHVEMAIVRTLVLQGCRYCVHAHTAVALDAGLDAKEVRALRGEVDVAEAFADPAEQALVAWIDCLAGTTGPVAEETWDTARAHWPDHVLVELSVTIGATMFLNRFATGFALPVPDDALADELDDGAGA